MRSKSSKQTFTCLHCGASFEEYPSRNRRYCSRACAARGRDDFGARNPNWRGGPVTKPCAHCGQSFTAIPAIARRRRYCSHNCYTAAQSGPLANAWSGGPVTRACDQCGRAYSAPRYRVEQGLTRYCSRDCQWAAKRVQDHEMYLLERREIDPKTGCWRWTGSTNIGGYGRAGFGVSAHRLAASLWLGFDLSSDRYVLHRCDQPNCFNPDHLFIGTAADNNRDKALKGRSYRGERHVRAKLTITDVQDIRRGLATGVSQRELALRYGVSKHAIHSIKAGKTWKHVPPPS